MQIEEITYKKLRWINITEPDQDMIEYLNQEFAFHELDLEDVISKYQYPKVDAYEKYLFLILQFPVYVPEKDLYTRSEFNIFFTNDFLITINDGDLTPLQNLFARLKKNSKDAARYLDRGHAYLMYEIIDMLFEHTFPYINDKYAKIFELEDAIYEKQEMRDVIQEIMILKRNIINLRRIVAPLRPVIMSLETRHKKFIPEELDIYFDDTVDKIDKIISQLDTAAAYTDVLEDANETIITRSTNRVIKTLTIFSVIMLPLTLVTSYYGMNIALPLQHNQHILTYINFTLLFIIVLMLGIFIKKRWL